MTQVPGPEIPFEYALALGRELQRFLRKSEDAKEGIKARAERKTPQFKGT